MPNITVKGLYVKCNVAPLIPGLRLVNREQFMCDAVHDELGLMLEFKCVASIFHRDDNTDSSVGRPFMRFYQSADIYKLCGYISTKQRVHSQLFFSFKSVLLINSYRLTSSVISFMTHHNMKLVSELLNELGSTMKGYTKQDIPKYLSSIYDNCRRELFNCYDTKSGHHVGVDSHDLNLSNENQLIGLIGAKTEDISNYVPGSMVFKFVELDNVDRASLYEKKVRLVINVDNSLSHLEFKHHFDVSFINTPLSMLDHEILFVVNNTRWVSIDEQVSNLVRNGYAGLARKTQDARRKGYKCIDFIPIYEEINRRIIPNYCAILDTIATGFFGMGGKL